MGLVFSKNLFDYGYSNGGITLADLLAGIPIDKCSNNKTYQELISIFIEGTYENKGFIGEYNFNKLLEQAIDYETSFNYVGFQINYDVRKTFTSVFNRNIIEFLKYSTSPILSKLNLYREIHLNKSFMVNKLDKEAEKRFFYAEPSFYLSVLNIDETTLMTNLTLLKNIYKTLVLKNLVDYATSNKGKIWLYSSEGNIDVEHIFVTKKFDKINRTLCIVADMDVSKKERNANELRHFLDKIAIKDEFIGVVLLPYGEYQIVDKIHFVPLSCLKS
jgi:hypothetical protein